MKRRLWAVGSDGFGVYEADWTESGPNLSRSLGEPEGLLAPGFVDLHIHGAFGFDFMSASSKELLQLADRLGGAGYEAFLPTTVSCSAEEALDAANRLPNDPRTPGFHLEGPFLSPRYPGAQPKEAIIEPPDGPSEWDEVLDHPKLRLATVAPERPGAPGLIRRLSRRGVSVSMGHTDASYAEAEAGVSAGATNVTHAFNAMRPFHHREPGIVGLFLTKDSLVTEVIYDRFHVSREALALLLKARPLDRIVAVSDGTLFAGGTKEEARSMWGHEVESKGGRVVLKGTDTLAGSAITLLDAFRNVWEDFGPEAAIRMCCLNPRTALAMSERARVYVEFDCQKTLVAVRRVHG